MGLRRPGMNRSLNRENPDILIVMITEQQIMRGGGEDKGDQRQGRDGPSKDCSRNEWHCTKEFGGEICCLCECFAVRDSSSAYEWEVLNDYCRTESSPFYDEGKKESCNFIRIRPSDCGSKLVQVNVT